ncbi:hypothetical protein CHS0354_012184 [Potamilus streckersoni]|uniref:Uncharacterized protein n=1 Tax=Potamilus streckersoni TaxID=2493646 RepID=A0AAE0S9Y7_9BIVA|nr:hypothetical protein CHS0354_012184 [Potamilus streckersoni]
MMLPRVTNFALHNSFRLNNLRVLLLSKTSNNLHRRVQYEIKKHGGQVENVFTSSEEEMEEAVKQFRPDVVVCPFLTARIPDSIWKERRCLIVHPGIAGDRGPSSIDWAIKNKQKSWGLTVLQAAEEMDAGDICCTSDFPVREYLTKASLYVGEVSDAAPKTVLESLRRLQNNVHPVPLDYSHPEVKGQLHATMKTKDRMIDWHMSAEEIAVIVRMSDTQPGAMASLLMPGAGGFDSIPFRLFDAHIERGVKSKYLQELLTEAHPGKIIGRKHGAILVKAGDEYGVWIGQLKRHVKQLALKQQSVSAFPFNIARNLEILPHDCEFSEIRIIRNGPLYYLHFDFYNGAMDKVQCIRLKSEIENISKCVDVKMLVLMGGDRFFSTGINLCSIEASENKYSEAWANINMLNDVIKAMVAIPDKLVVAALQGNAGAGGAMFAAAADIVVSHPGVLLTPSYSSMHLHGSEYWTYFLPQRVGEMEAIRLTQSDDPLVAEEAHKIGLVDYILGENKTDFLSELPEFLIDFCGSKRGEEILRKKRDKRTDLWLQELEMHRFEELEKMKRNFVSQEFQTAMKKFVYHLKDNDRIQLENIGRSS